MVSENPQQILAASDRIIVGQDLIPVGEKLAAAFGEGDRLLGIAETKEILHLGREELLIVSECVGRSHVAFEELRAVSDDSLVSFFSHFAKFLSDQSVIERVGSANATDISDAKSRGRSTGRLELTEQVRLGMIESLAIWENQSGTREIALDRVGHEGWSVESVSAPLGVVGFVFEGRPNVCADATGVLRSGNTCVLRIGSDALRTASAIMELAIGPALARSGLPSDAIQLINSKSHSAGWALFSDSRVALAIARGSGPAVAQLGAVARQAGIPVSLHGTGGAWFLAGDNADVASFEDAVRNSLDRKVCNTLNVVCIPQSRTHDLLPALERGLTVAASVRGTVGIVHYVADRYPKDCLHNNNLNFHLIDESQLATEWEWDSRPECSVVVTRDLAHSVSLCNRYSPQFIVSVLSSDGTEQDFVWKTVNAPFVGDGMSRWVDGQFALQRPELGLSNWRNGRLLGRGGILSGDSVFTVRLRATMRDSSLHR